MVEQVAGVGEFPDAATVRRAIGASAMGNAIEWYDYGVFTSGRHRDQHRHGLLPRQRQRR